MKTIRASERRVSSRGAWSKKQGSKEYYHVDYSGLLIMLMVIVPLLAVLVVPRLFPKLDQGKHYAAKAQMEMLGQALDQFKKDVGRYPTSSEGLDALIKDVRLKGWAGPYVKGGAIPSDPWGRPYRYESPGRHGSYDLYSYGADGVPGGDGANQDTSW